MRTCGTFCLALLPLLTVGCVTLDKVWPGCHDKPPTGPVHQVAVTWNNEVMHGADSVHGGTVIPGIGGRMFLFGPQIDFPLAGDGSVSVELYDETAGPATVPMEIWNFDAVTLKRLLRKDMIGWGYTLPLRWSTWKPEVAIVRLKLCYQPKKGAPLYAESAPMTLNDKEANTAGPPLAKKPGTPTTTPTSAPKTAAPAAVKPVGKLLPPAAGKTDRATPRKGGTVSAQPRLGFTES